MKYIIGNWKMNPASEEEAKVIARGIAEKSDPSVYLGIAAPFIYLDILKNIVAGKVELWAQDAFNEPSGAFTGEISVPMLKNFGVSGVIIGHSERRRYFGETDDVVNKKLIAILGSGMKAILCVGEKNRLSGKLGTMGAKKIVLKQLKRNLSGMRGNTVENLIIAYEPIWAIGTGRNALLEDAEEMAYFIKSEMEKNLGIKNQIVIYGGSANGNNTSGFFKQKSIDGLLLGGASLKVKEMDTIINLAVANSG